MTPSAPPPPPNAGTTSDAQQSGNISAALAQQALNLMNQQTPYGSIGYSQNGYTSIPNPFGGPPLQIPNMTATTTLSPQMQQLVNSQLGNNQGAANLAGRLERQLKSTMASPLNLGPSATSAYLDSIAQAELNPQIAQAQAQLNQQLANQGLTPGSAGWGYQQGQFGLNAAQAQNNLILQGQNTANQALMAQYTLPLNALTQLTGASQPSQPGVGQLAPSPQGSIQPANYQGQVNSNYQSQMAGYNSQLAQQNALMSGIFGIGGAALGNPALAAFAPVTPPTPTGAPVAPSLPA